MKQAAELEGAPLRRHTFRTLLLTLYCTGLRFGEPWRARMCDLDLRGRTLTVTSKGRTRRVPFRKDLARELARYLRERKDVAAESPQDSVFVQPNGRPYSIKAASSVVRKLLRRSGLKPPRGGLDLAPMISRATFAVHRLTRWYKAGLDIHGRLPFLSAYMGHKTSSAPSRTCPRLQDSFSSRAADSLRESAEVILMKHLDPLLLEACRIVLPGSLPARVRGSSRHTILGLSRCTSPVLCLPFGGDERLLHLVTLGGYLR